MRRRGRRSRKRQVDRDTERQRHRETQRDRHRHRNRETDRDRVNALSGGGAGGAVGRDQRLGGCSADADRHAWRGLV